LQQLAQIGAIGGANLRHLGLVGQDSRGRQAEPPCIR
jgi:hypothetical protein